MQQCGESGLFAVPAGSSGLERERERFEQYIANRSTHVYSRHENPWGSLTDVLIAIGNAGSGGAANVGEPTSVINEQIHQDNEDITEQRHGIISSHERRIAEIDIEILAIEQSISLALQNCPCLWSTEFS